MAQKRSVTRFFVWIIVGLLIVGMLGFGATGLTGSQSTLGTVGDKTVSINAFARALNGEAQVYEAQLGRPLTVQEIQGLGLDRVALSRVVATRALDHEAAENSLSLGDDRLRDIILNHPAFVGLNGQFDRAIYGEVLARSGSDESEFETSLREEAARGILQTAITGSVTAPDAYVDTLVGYLGETRDFTWARLDAGMLTTGVPLPTAGDLNQFYQDNSDQFMTPATRQITYIWLTPEQMLDQIPVDEATLQQLYQDRITEFVTPERRIVDRLVFPDQDAAQAAHEAITAGTSDFDAEVTKRGLTPDDVALGDVSADDLGTAGAAVFAFGDIGVTAPIETNLGPALFRVVAILDAQNTTFEQVRDDLRDEYAADQARRQIAALAEEAEDILAGGATLEELSSETPLSLGALDWHNGLQDGIAAYQEFRIAVQNLNEESFPTMLMLEDGGAFALRLDGTTPPALPPLDDIRDAVTAAWDAQATQTALLDMGTALSAQLETSATFIQLGLFGSPETGLARMDFIDNAPPFIVGSAFDLEAGQVDVLEGVDEVFLIRLNAIHAADMESDIAQAMQSALRERLNIAYQGAVFEAYTNALVSQTEQSIDQGMVSAVTNQIR